MSINLRMPETTELKPRITVFGVGGAGGNAVNNMIESNLQGVEFVAANSDAQALHHSRAERTIQIGAAITEGLGAGARPEVGRAAAEESLPEIIDNLVNTHMVFITAGMGGGTGTGAAPVIAQAAREQGILTVGVVTKPFQFEGSRRMRIAEEGILELQKYVDTLIIIPNQNLFRVANEKTTFADAFAMADEVLHSGVRGITDLMVMPGLINLDFADVRTVMDEMGKAMMGTGEATGDKRALESAEAAISNPLLDEVSMKGARGVLINITGGMDLTLFEVDEAANRIRAEVDPEANIIVGSTFDENMSGEMRVSVVATGINAEEALMNHPQGQQQSVVTPLKRPGAAPWRGGVNKPGPKATSAVAAAAVQSPEGQAETETMRAPAAQPEPAFEPEIEPEFEEGYADDTHEIAASDAQEATGRATADDQEAAEPYQPSDTGSPAQELIQKANEFATRNERTHARATPPRTEPARRQAEARGDGHRGAGEQESMFPGFEDEIEERRPARPQKKGLLSGLKGRRQRLFSAPDEEEDRIEPAAPRQAPQKPVAQKASPRPSRPEAKPEARTEGMEGAPKVSLSPREQLGDPGQQDDLDIPAFLRRPSN